MATTFDTTVSLCNTCNYYHVDINAMTTLLELLGGLDKEQTEKVLYQASIVAAVEKLYPTRTENRRKAQMNENEIQVWNYESSEVRTVQVNGEPWFVLSDVCKVLELSSPHKVADRLENDERNQIPVTDSLGRYQNTAIINESGLYTVILRSDKPQAKPFRKWVTSEVLPSIQKHGSYSVQSQFADLSPQLQILIQMETRQAEQATALAGLEQKIQNTCEVIALDKTAWRKDSEHLINKIARATGEGYDGIRLVYGTSYKKSIPQKQNSR